MFLKNLTLKPKVFQFDRREFMRITGMGGIALGVGSMLAKNLHAQEMDQKCATIDGAIDLSGKATESDLIQYWIDGSQLNERSNVQSRANLSLLFQMSQTDKKYVDAIVLTDEQGNTMGVRFFDSSDKMSDGYPPYVIFDNIELNYQKKYYLFCQVTNGTNVDLYKFTLKDARQSYFNKSFLPQQVINDFSTFMGNNVGLPTTPFQYYTRNGIALHTARGVVQDIGSDGSFRVDLRQMHGDSSATTPADLHYMRYFIVADPVGRILGLRKRDLDPANPNNGYDGTTIFANPSMQVKRFIDQNTLSAWGISQSDVANILDCPFIQIFTEDVFDSLARSVLRLR